MAKKKRGNQLVSGELRGFIEHYERLSAEMAEIADQRKEVMAEAKGRGYDTKVMRLLIRERARDPDELSEERAIAALYRDALGMEGTPLDDWAKGPAPEVVAVVKAEAAAKASGARVDDIVGRAGGKRGSKSGARKPSVAEAAPTDAEIARAQGIAELDPVTRENIAAAQALNSSRASVVTLKRRPSDDEPPPPEAA